MAGSRRLSLVVPGSTPALDDARLVAGIRSGDRAMANAFVSRVEPRVRACIRRLLGRYRHEHDDAAQLSLIELVTTIDRYRGQCNLDTWSDRLTAHVVFKQLRRSRLELRLFEGLAEQSLEVAGPHSAERAALASSAVARLRELVADVSPDRLSAWVLFDVHGFTLEEVAEVTGASLSATQSRLVRGRSDVRERLALAPELLDTLEGLELSR